MNLTQIIEQVLIEKKTRIKKNKKKQTATYIPQRTQTDWSVKDSSVPGSEEISGDGSGV